MKLFNDIIDLGMEDDWILDLVNVLVILHLLGFFVMLIVIFIGCRKSEQEHFQERVKALN